MKNQPSRKILFLCAFVFVSFFTHARAYAQVSMTAYASAREVTASEYCNFLNQAAVTDPDHLFDQKMSTDPETASIVRLGTPRNFHYEVIAGRENFLISYLNFWDEENYCAETGDVLFTSHEKGDQSLKSNQAGFEIKASSSPTLSLALSSPSNSTSNLNSCLEVAGLVGLIAFGSAFVTLEDFRQAAAHPDNAGAKRLVVGDNGKILPSDHVGFKVTSEDDQSIASELRTALERDSHSSTFVTKLIGEELQPPLIERLVRGRAYLSTERLTTIIRKADAAKAQKMRLLQRPSSSQSAIVISSAAPKKTFYGTIKKLLPSEVADNLPPSFEEFTEKSQLARQRYSRIQDLIFGVVNADRGSALFDYDYAEPDRLWSQAEQAWKAHSAMLQSREIKKGFLKWLFKELQQEKKRLADLKGKTLGDILLEKAEEGLDRAARVANPSVSGDALEAEIEKFTSEISSGAANSFYGSLEKIIDLPDISFKGAAGAGFSLLKWALQKNNEIYQDSLQDDLAHNHKEHQRTAEEISTAQADAERLSNEALAAERIANETSVSLPGDLARKIKSPSSKDLDEWKGWAQQLIQASGISERDCEEWIRLIPRIGAANPEYWSKFIADAWRERIEKSDSLLEDIRTNQQQEMEQLQVALKRAEQESIDASARHQGAQAALEAAEKNKRDLETSHRHTTEKLDELHHNAPVAGQEGAHEALIRGERQKLADLSVSIEKATADYEAKKKTAKDSKLNFEIAQAIAREIARIYIERSERYSRWISRAEIRAAADQEAWKRTWPEIYYKELADEAWSEAEREHEISEDAWPEVWRGAMDHCATAGSDWVAQANSVAEIFMTASQFARNAEAVWAAAMEAQDAALTNIPDIRQTIKDALIANKSNAESKKIAWTQRALQAEKNALDAKDPRVAEAKAAWLLFQEAVEERTVDITDINFITEKLRIIGENNIVSIVSEMSKVIDAKKAFCIATTKLESGESWYNRRFNRSNPAYNQAISSRGSLQFTIRQVRRAIENASLDENSIWSQETEWAVSFIKKLCGGIEGTYMGVGGDLADDCIIQ